MIESKPIFAERPPHGDGTALRAIAWPELIARINAARDLRVVLSRDNAWIAASFSDAAAGYFSEQAESKRAVNPDVLGHRKPYNFMEALEENNAAAFGEES